MLSQYFISLNLFQISDLCHDGNFCTFLPDTRCKEDATKINCPKKCKACDIVTGTLIFFSIRLFC